MMGWDALEPVMVLVWRHSGFRDDSEMVRDYEAVIRTLFDRVVRSCVEARGMDSPNRFATETLAAALRTSSFLQWCLAEDTTTPPDFPVEEGCHMAGYSAAEDSVAHRWRAQVQMTLGVCK
jgi:hypothetical protein